MAISSSLTPLIPPLSISPFEDHCPQPLLSYLLICLWDLQLCHFLSFHYTFPDLVYRVCLFVSLSDSHPPFLTHSLTDYTHKHTHSLTHTDKHTLMISFLECLDDFNIISTYIIKKCVLCLTKHRSVLCVIILSFSFLSWVTIFVHIFIYMNIYHLALTSGWTVYHSMPNNWF